MKLIYLTILTILVVNASQTRTPEALADQVLSLPGYYNFTPDFEMYSGYLTLQQ
jgi:hypothetical protein